MTTYTLKVVDIIKETEDTTTICFKQPNLRKIKYEAGQYLTLIFRINGRRYLRPYSFSSAPSADETLQITVKRVLNGVVSNHIHDKVNIGDTIELLHPMGNFVYRDKPHIKSIYFWAAGSGITPIMSLIKEILLTNSSVKLNLVYGNKNHETTIFAKQIDDLLQAHPAQLKVWYFYSRLTIAKDDTTIIEGRIDHQYISTILSNADTANSLHYICGPAGLKNSVKEELKKRGVANENLFFEDFELEKDPKDFEDIYTQNVKFKFEGSNHELEVIKGKSILEAALDAGYELPYSCQTGICNTCKATLIEGKIKMIGISDNMPIENKNEYLLCCAHPLTENVYLEI